MVMLKGLATSMNAKISGTGPADKVIVLGHGYGGEQSFWDKIVPCLEENHQVLVFDWNFSGHSISGMIGCIASTMRPHLFKKLILIGASPRYINSEDYEGGFEASEIDQLLSTIEQNYQGWATAFAPVAVGGKDKVLADKFATSLQKMKPEVASAVAKIIFLGDYRYVLDKVETPCTIISTSNDVVVPSSVPYYMQKTMINAKSSVEIIDVDGHFPQLTAHDEVLNVISKVLA